MKVRLLNSGGYETCASMTFPCEIEVPDEYVMPCPAGGPYGIIEVPVSTLIEHGGTARVTTQPSLCFVHDIQALGLSLGLNNEAEIVED